MKRSKQTWIVSSAILIFVMACTILSTEPSSEGTPINETVMAAASALLAQTQAALPTSTVIPTGTLPVPISTLDITPTITPLPDFAPTEIPGLLHSALTVETLSDFNGHNLQRISGWKYGFHTIEWLGSNHVMLYPYAGVTNAVTDRTVAGTYPAVINLTTKSFWIPYLSHATVDGRATLAWSEQLGKLIIAGPDWAVRLYSPDGDSTFPYAGVLLGVSPSGTKILIDGDTWIDLTTGNIVDFAWYQTGYAAERAAYQPFRPIWSPDEMRVYVCCYAYGDARTGDSFVMPYDGINLDGEKTDFSMLAFGGTWVLNDRYMMPIWGGVWDGRYSSVFLFDPAGKTLWNLSARAGVFDDPESQREPYCNRPSAQKGGRYVWVDCLDGGHLIDLATFRSKKYPPFESPYGEGTFFTSEVDWSADGTFARMSGDGFEYLLSTATQELGPLPEDCSGFTWHPNDNVLLCMANNGQRLLLRDARTLAVLNETNLPAEFFNKGWSPDGKHLALLARESNSLWTIDYPGLDNLEQWTSAMPGLTRQIPQSNITKSLINHVVWSEDGSALAFIGSSDVYIVNVERVP